MNIMWPISVFSSHHGTLTDDLECLDQFRREGFLCDAVLVSNDHKAFPVHRLLTASASLYLEECFLHKSHDDSMIHVDMDGNVLDQLVGWIYTAQLVIADGENLLQLLLAADVLKFVGFHKDCIDALEQNGSTLMSNQDVVTLWQLVVVKNSHSLVLTAVEEFCRQYFVNNFSSIFNSHPDVFTEMSMPDLLSTLKEDALAVPDEDFVWNVIQKWVQHDPNSRTFKHLLKSIRMGLLSRSVYEEMKSYAQEQDVSETEDFLANYTKICFREEELKCKMLATPRLPQQLVFVLLTQVGPAHQSFIFSFDTRSEMWLRLPISLPSYAISMAPVLLNGGTEAVIVAREPLATPRIYAVDIQNCSNKKPPRQLSTLNMESYFGGCPLVVCYKNRLTACLPNGLAEVYDEKLNLWTVRRLVKEDQVLLEFMMGAAYVTLDDQLFKIGGMNNNLTLITSDVKVFSEDSQGFEFVGTLNQGRAFPSCCCAVDGKIIVAGGFSRPFSGSLKSVEEFDPRSGRSRLLANMDVYTNDCSVVPLLDGFLVLEGHEVTDMFRVTWASNVRQVQFYDRQTNTWHVKTPFVDDTDAQWMVLGAVAAAKHNLQTTQFLHKNRWEGMLQVLARNICEQQQQPLQQQQQQSSSWVEDDEEMENNIWHLID